MGTRVGINYPDNLFRPFICIFSLSFPLLYFFLFVYISFLLPYIYRYILLIYCYIYIANGPGSIFPFFPPAEKPSPVTLVLKRTKKHRFASLPVSKSIHTPMIISLHFLPQLLIIYKNKNQVHCRGRFFYFIHVSKNKKANVFFLNNCKRFAFFFTHLKILYIPSNTFFLTIKSLCSSFSTSCCMCVKECMGVPYVKIGA